MTKGLHHITCISADAQKTYNFYNKLLGLRLVKKTVNFDSPETYHLYFGNDKGSPGTILTFFPFQQTNQGIHGCNMANKITFTVPPNALQFWQSRLYNKLIKVQITTNPFGQQELQFNDSDGQQCAFIEEQSPISPWVTTDIPHEYAIRSFATIELSVENCQKTREVLELLGYQLQQESLTYARFHNPNAPYAAHIDIKESIDQPKGLSGYGTVHHIAFRVPDRSHQENLQAILRENGLNPTPIIDRQYFTSVYFRDPNTILCEIATDNPGFEIDEQSLELGTNLKLPPQYEQYRQIIEKQLPPLKT